MIDVLIDNIIFSLQKVGGASVVWQQHIKRLLSDSTFKCLFYEYESARMNLFRKELQIPSTNIVSINPKLFIIERYLNLHIKRNDPYIFHSSHYRFLTDKNARNVTTVHDFTYEYFVTGFRKKIHSFQKNKSILNSELIICISQSTKKDLLKFVPKVNEELVKVVYNGVDDKFVLLDGDKDIESLNFLPYGALEYILYVGDRKNGYKNFSAVVLACQLTGFPLVMVGGGVLTNIEIAYLEKKLGLGHYKSLGNVSTKILNILYNNAFCLLYPSAYEGFGIPVIEAQKAGCPVIAYRGSSVAEIIGDTKYALDDVSGNSIAEAINLMLNSAMERDKTIRLGIENSGKFSWQNTYEQTTELYKKILY